MRWTPVTLFLVAVLAGACSSDPTEVVSGSDETAEGVIDDSGEASSDDSLTAPESTTTTTTFAPAVADDSAPVAVSSGTVDILGLSMAGTGEWAVFRPTTDDDGESECRDGVLAYVIDGELVHTYDELSFAGGIRLFNGPGGQDAFVINCEESVERIAFAASTVVGDARWPDTADLIGAGTQGVSFAFTADFGWYGDLFGGYGTHVDGHQALFVIDRGALEIVPLDSRVGARSNIEPTTATSPVVPTSWWLDSEFEGFTVASSSSLSRVQVWTADGAIDAPLAEGDDLLSSDGVMVRLWSGAGAETAQVSNVVQATEWIFVSDDGVRVVRHVPRETDTVVIEMFSDASDSSIDDDLPWLTLELLQIFEPA